MANQNVFQENQELDRLAVQNRLLKAYEKQIYQQILSGRSELKLLDIGCNNGSKTVDRFACENIAQVIGLEYHHDLAAKAQESFGGEGFAFYQCDVESPGFAGRLRDLMAQNNVEGFDIIYISFVLMHLKSPDTLLKILRDFLAPQGQLIVLEANDAVNQVIPDEEGLFQEFLKILCLDPFSGDRNCGSKLPTLLEQCGYQQITFKDIVIQANGDDPQKKSDIFETFCSYLPQDLHILQEQEPDNPQYAVCGAWLASHYDTLQRLILEADTEISMGVSAITCLGGME